MTLPMHLGYLDWSLLDRLKAPDVQKDFYCFARTNLLRPYNQGLTFVKNSDADLSTIQLSLKG